MKHPLDGHVRRFCEEKGISLAEFGRRMRVTRPTVYNIMEGIYSRGMLERIAYLMKVEPWELLKK